MGRREASVVLTRGNPAPGPRGLEVLVPCGYPGDRFCTLERNIKKNTRLAKKFIWFFS